MVMTWAHSAALQATYIDTTESSSIVYETEPILKYLKNVKWKMFIQHYSIVIFTHYKLRLGDAIHNYKLAKIREIWQVGGYLFSNVADLIDIAFYL